MTQIAPYIRAKFPLLNHPELLQILEANGEFHSIQAGESIIRPGQNITSIPLIISGLIRIVKFDSQKREVFLYFLEEGQTCAMSLNCCSMQHTASIQAIAEVETEFILIPSSLIDSLYAKFQNWRAFMSNTYAERFQELFAVVEEMAFNKLDHRLLNYLNKLVEKKQTQVLEINHAQIAKDLNTSREVISRLLKALEQTGGIVLGRNKITFVK